ncbi:MAG TPA: cyclic nucleotide-binding domain-containing protein, partial [Nitrospirota bacterium]|nr:cyclic nucleotide-binding domain-containing protein [Nitrospirota bacterium]
LAVLNPGDFFGEMSFLADKPRTATVETTEDSDILEVTEEQLRQLLAKRPHVLDVLKQFSDARERGTRLKMEAAQKAAAQTAPAAAPKPRPVPPVQNIPPANPAEKPRLVDAIQKCISKCDWKSAIADMEKLFTIDKDPIIRVRMGDAHQKLNQKPQAVREYMYAADLYAEKGAVVKALAQYKLALRLDPANKEAQECIAALHSNKTVKENRPEQGEKEAQRPASSVIPLFAGFSQEEFNAFTQVMNVHPLPAGVPIIEQHDTGKSVYLIANGSVKVYTAMLSGERVDLAVLRSGDFFGEMSFLTGKPRTATVETAEDAELLEITEDKLREIISQHPRMLDVLQHYYDVRSKGTADKMKDSSKG